MDRGHRYKSDAKQPIRDRCRTLYTAMGATPSHEPNGVDDDSLIDLPEIGGKLYGSAFEAWFVKQDLGTRFLFRLAEETGVVLLHGNGTEVVNTPARVSLPNLTEFEYAAIGRFTRQVLDDCQKDFDAISMWHRMRADRSGARMG